MTDDQLDMIKHAYGVDSREPGYRTHYCTSLVDENMLDLVKQGYFQGPTAVGIVGEGHGIYHLTDKGIELAETFVAPPSEKERTLVEALTLIYLGDWSSISGEDTAAEFARETLKKVGEYEEET